MGWFDPPAIVLRKRIPGAWLAGFNTAEEFALHQLHGEFEQHQPYQLGVVLALWIKAGEMSGKISLAPRDSRKVQSIYESCMRVLGAKSFESFCIIANMAEQDFTFGTPSEIYRQLSWNVAAA